MRKSAVLVTLLVLALGVGLHACGGDEDRRRHERCDSCQTDQIDVDCLDQCRRFCTATEDCDERCNRECDRCKAELECRVCTSDCTGTVARCAPNDEPITCDDGVF
jgi:hypothetical protein